MGKNGGTAYKNEGCETFWEENAGLIPCSLAVTSSAASSNYLPTISPAVSLVKQISIPISNLPISNLPIYLSTYLYTYIYIYTWTHIHTCIPNIYIYIYITLYI